MNPVTAALPRLATPAHARRMLRRAVLFWIALRASLLFLSAAGVAGGLPPAGVLLVAGIVAFLCHVDARIMREPIFYGNLGTPGWVPAAVGAVWSLIGELLIIAALAALQVVR